MKATMASRVLPEAEPMAKSRPSVESWVDKGCRWLTQAVLIGLILMIAAEVVARGVFGVSLQVTDELGGYALLAIAFFGLPTCQAHDAFHHVHFLDAKLRPLPKAWFDCVFSAMSLAAMLVLCWQFALFTLTTYQSGDVAATTLLTPLWMPRLAMTLGTGCLSLSLLRTLYRNTQRIGEIRAIGIRRG